MGRTCVRVEWIEVPVNIKTLLYKISKDGKKSWVQLNLKAMKATDIQTPFFGSLCWRHYCCCCCYCWTLHLLKSLVGFLLLLLYYYVLLSLLLYIHLCIMVINVWMKKNEHHNFLWVRMSKWAPLIEQIKSNFSKVCWKMRKDTNIIGFCSHFCHH